MAFKISYNAGPKKHRFWHRLLLVETIGRTKCYKCRSCNLKMIVNDRSSKQGDSDNQLISWNWLGITDNDKKEKE